MKIHNITKNTKNIITGLLLYAASCGLCYADTNDMTGSSVVPLKTVLVKFAISMGSVLISLIVIFIVLAYFRKQYGGAIDNRNNPDDLYGDSLGTPKNIEDAIISFIDKNRL